MILTTNGGSSRYGLLLIFLNDLLGRSRSFQVYLVLSKIAKKKDSESGCLHFIDSRKGARIEFNERPFFYVDEIYDLQIHWSRCQ